MNHTNVDPLVDEVRNGRKAICETFDHDVDTLCDYFQHQERVVKPVRGLLGGVRQGRSEGEF